MRTIRWSAPALVILAVNVLLLLFTASGTAGALMLRLTLDEMARSADAVVIGTAVSTSSRWNAERTHINTTVVVSVEETLKGRPSGNTITITVPGGTADGITEWVEHAAVFQPGERSVVFLKRLPDTRYELYGENQGKLRVVDGKVDDVPLAEFKRRVGRAIQRGAPVTPKEDSDIPVGPVLLDVGKLTDRPPGPPQSGTKSPAWQTILSDGFEGAFPGVWQTSGAPNPAAWTWGKTSYNYHSGANSVWCLGSLADPASSNYLNGVNAWMVYGPFSLSDATVAELSFYRWLKTEAGHDSFYYGLSTDGRWFYGYYANGQYDSWTYRSRDLRTWGYFGNLMGQQQVWLAFWFTSDSNMITDKGVFIDDVLLRKYTGTAPQITAIAPSSASAGTNTAITISGTGFGGTPGQVDFYYRYGEPYISGGIVSWTDTRIVTTVPTAIINNYSASASSGPAWAVTSDNIASIGYPFTVTFSYGGKRWPGASPVVGYRVNPNTPDASGEEQAVQNAAATWSATPGQTFGFRYDGTTSAVQYSRNSVNEVLWRDLGADGPVARAYSWSDSGILLETDIEFNERYTWSTAAAPGAGQYDVESIALHELGHWLNLRDLYGDVSGYPQDVDKVMFGYGGSGGTKRSLHSADIEGIRWIYPGAGVVPGVITDNATNVSGTSATLNATLTSLGSSANVTVSFQWGATDNYGNETTPVALSTTGSFSANITGLSLNTTYYFRAKAVGAGTVYGSGTTFRTTQLLPAVTTGIATYYTDTSANVTGTLTSLGTASTVQLSFQWGLTDNYASETAVTTLTAPGSFSANITGLSPGTRYHYRAKAVGNFPGHGYFASYGLDRTFTTQATPPTITTDSATNITTTSAVLNGTVVSLGNAPNVSVTLSFQWGRTTAYTYETTPVTSNTTGPFSAAIGDLSPGTTYHFRVKWGVGGVAYAEDRVFTTLSATPTVTTHNATGISGISALLLGTLVDLGGNASVQLSFQYGTSANYTSETTPSAASTAGPFGFYLTGLSENTTYHFRAKAAGASTAYGSDMTFRTEVVEGVRIEGLTYEAKGTPLSGVTVTLDGVSSNVSDSNGIYRVTANATGPHTVVASKTGFRSLTQTVNAASMPATLTVHFTGRYGLVPNRPDLSYVLACVNRWKFPPADGSAPDLSRVLSVVNAWKFPL